MNPETASAVCSYCQSEIVGEKFLLVDEEYAIVLRLHPWCATKLAKWSPALAARCNEFWDDIAVREKKRNL
jgi:hypothetical protein